MAVSAAAAVTRPQTRRLRIVLIDDHAIVRQGLRFILDREQDMHVVGEASSAAEAMTVVAQQHPDIVLLDLKLSTGSDIEGLEVCSELTRRFPQAGVLVLTTFLDDALVLEAIHRGAKGYVLKDVDTTALVSSIRAVARDESAFDPRSASVMMRTIRTAPEEPTLTDRETKVLELLARGMSNREIGGRLYISETTVKFHVRNIMRKLSASTRAGAVYEASKLGLI
ncbi:response regulator transcription factor [Nocardia farcinica]|uniref:Transcriptional regulatory protein devR (DosR) n=2 Tax=Nocardia TaxID=1817 RepID=A0A0H5P1X5_NOCFR|nr:MULTISPECIES: response regulator transcription factor [Nocardia]AXK85206.1 DNA-binding response regulator [Nocardia farcinica]MBA4858263.1 response regulator transcription factor [Nocardia farcinica]MBC9818032.1 response regulator transcription factor [Nocardia farcinica]MBF6067901.1 response regulator transcription factor [Nocardia farcinica]MBF6140226.1 response regulator transcription factor [Nocardia farcinica]